MTNISDIKLIGSSICLDFVNTVHDRSLPDSADYIGGGSASLLAWCAYAGVWDKAMITKLQAQENDEAAQSKVYQKALELRAILFNLFSALADSAPLPAADLSDFNHFLSETLVHKRVVADGAQLVSAWDLPAYRADLVLWPIVEAAYGLLTGGDYERIKKCPACGWVFIDKSKGGRRRWCSMDTCGTLDKSRRYYHGKVKDQQTK